MNTHRDTAIPMPPTLSTEFVANGFAASGACDLVCGPELKRKMLKFFGGKILQKLQKSPRPIEMARLLREL